MTAILHSATILPVDRSRLTLQINRSSLTDLS
nr:MAG TPA: hypothetical protein [Caudoviricetes sp.]